MVKVKLLEIVNSRETLSSLMNEKLPMAVSYKLAKIFKAVAPELEIIEQQRQRMIKELGEPIGEEEGAWRVKKENEAEFQKQFNELLNEEIELSFDPVPVSVFEILDDKISISPFELSKIQFIFE